MAALALAPALEHRPASGFFARAAEERAPASSAVLVVAGKGLRIGGRAVDPGTYAVRLDESRERIVLENEARTYALTAFFRRAKEAARAALEAFLEPGEQGRSFVVVRVGNGTEWVA